MAVVSEKRCKQCGKDVSQVKRTKDAAGYYYCEACVQAARRQPQAGGAPAAAATRVCDNCRKPVGPLQQLWDWQGHQVCYSCRDSLLTEEDERIRQAKEKAAAEADAVRAQAARTAQAAAVGRQRDRERRRTLLTGLISSALAAAFFTFWLLVDMNNPKDQDRTPLYIALGVATFAGLMTYGYRKAAGTPLIPALRRDLLPTLGLLFGRMSHFVVMLIVICALVVIPLAAAAGGTAASSAVFGKSPVNMVGTVAGLVVGAGVSVALFRATKEAERGKCPNCEAWFKSVVERSDLVGRDVRTVKEMKNVQVRDGINPYGQVVANLQVPTEKTVVTDHFAVHRRCAVCGHRWATRQ